MDRFSMSLIFTFLLAMHAPAGSTAQTQTASDSTIQTLQKIDDLSSIVLFRNDQYVISASLKAFNAHFDTWLRNNPGVPGDDKLRELITNAAKSSQVIDAVQLAEKHNVLLRLNYRLADMLQAGQCMVYDKKTFGPVASVTMQRFTSACGKNCTEHGRRFLLNAVMLFSVIDEIR